MTDTNIEDQSVAACSTDDLSAWDQVVFSLLLAQDNREMQADASRSNELVVSILFLDGSCRF